MRTLSAVMARRWLGFAAHAEAALTVAIDAMPLSAMGKSNWNAAFDARTDMQQFKSELLALTVAAVEVECV